MFLFYTTSSGKVCEVLWINLCGVIMASNEKLDLESKQIYKLEQINQRSMRETTGSTSHQACSLWFIRPWNVYSDFSLLSGENNTTEAKGEHHENYIFFPNSRSVCITAWNSFCAR